MISDELSIIVNNLQAQGKMAFLDGATTEQISEFEKVHEISFPQKYKEWLQFSDGGECFLPAGVQFYGVAHKPLIDVNDDDRPNDQYVVIGALASGDPILCHKENETIAIYNHEDGRIEEDERFENFFDFLTSLSDLLGIGE